VTLLGQFHFSISELRFIRITLPVLQYNTNVQAIPLYTTLKKTRKHYSRCRHCCQDTSHDFDIKSSLFGLLCSKTISAEKVTRCNQWRNFCLTNYSLSSSKMGDFILEMTVQ
jgi:hypothetical protein